MMEHVKAKIRDIRDFPEPGILFKDLTPVIADPQLTSDVCAALAAPFRDHGITQVAGMEARGFIFGALVARELNAGFIPLRKPGKLPAASHSVSYALEYGNATLEIHQDAATQADTVLLVDDLIATGGTAAASAELVAKTGAQIAGFAFVVELDFLSGRDSLTPYDIHSLIHY